MDQVRRLLHGWRASEQRVYSLALSDPETYERSLRAVRTVADALGTFGSREDLLEAHADGGPLAAGALRDAGLRPEDVSVPDVVGAAFALRLREILGGDVPP